MCRWGQHQDNKMVALGCNQGPRPETGSDNQLIDRWGLFGHPSDQMPSVAFPCNSVGT